MPSIDDVFGGTTLKSEDIKGKEPTVTIESVTTKEFTDKEGVTKKKLLVSFVGSKKALVCNVTNARRIAHLHGPDYGLWAGKQVQLKVEMVDFGGKIMDGIRVFPPQRKAAPAPAGDFPDDDIPF
jgi:hypothetical protein